MRPATLTLLLLTAAALPSSAEERSTALLAPGTHWETAYHIIDSGAPGPTVILTGGIHGDEPAGARAAEQIRHWPIQKGRLIVIPRANVPALNAGKRLMPGIDEKAQRDLNRNFPKDNTTPKGEIARELWTFISNQKPDWLIDLHEGFDFHQEEATDSVGSSIIDSNSEAANAAAPAMLAAVNAPITDPKRRFVNLGPPVGGSLARAAAERLGASTMILETTSKDQPLSLRARQHRIMVRQFLLDRGMLPAATGTTINLVTPPPSAAPRVALYDDKGTGGKAATEATAATIPNALVWRVGAEDIRDGALAGFDLVIFPGGSGSAIAKALGEKGRAQVKTFVENGGGYTGICAGAYLSASNYDWSLAFSNQRTFSAMHEIPGEGQKSMWYRGPSSTVTMELSDAGKEIFGHDHPGEFPVTYHNGPIIPPLKDGEKPTYEILAWFRSEVSKYEPQKGTMTHTPAMISTTYGKGRVLVISPHPEASKALRPMLAKGLLWAAGKAN